MCGNTTKCLVIGLGAVALVIALAGRQTRSADGRDFRFDAAQLKDTTLWTRVNAEPYYISSALDALCRMPLPGEHEAARKQNPHAATFITVYVNAAGRESMLSQEPRRFPEGSVIVKEKVATASGARTPLLYTLMMKREPGYNPAVGDWEFMVVSGDGARTEGRGKLENCQACHIRKPDSDFVFRPYLGSK